MVTLLLMAFLQDESELLDAVAAGDPAPIETALQKIISLNRGRSATALHRAYEKSVPTLKSLEKERADWEKKIEETKDVYDDHGTHVKGNPIECAKAKDELGKVLGKIRTLEVYQPRFLRGLEKLTSDDAVAGVVQLLKSGDWFVRAHAVTALGARDKANALVELASKESEPGVRVALADALAGRPEGRSILEGYLRNDYWQVRIAASRSLASIGDKRSVEPLISALKGTEGRVQDEINQALKAITGVDKNGSYAAWNEWWSLHQEEFLKGEYRPLPSERAEGKGGSLFYGVRVKSTRILFILDVSASMLQKAAWKPEEGSEKLKGDRCLDVAQYELRRFLKQLPDSAEFNVMLLYGGNALAFEKFGKGKAQRDRALKFLDSIQIIDGTDISGALLRAFDLCGGASISARPKLGGFDTIFLITDGITTGGIQDPKLLVERIVEVNRFRKVAIHAVGIHSSGEGVMLLKPLAEATGGSYTER